MTAGRIKHNPATINPFQPARSWPMCIAISVLLGPGMRFVASIKSSKCCSSIHFRFLTTSSCMMAMWVAGPLNPFVSSFYQYYNFF